MRTGTPANLLQLRAAEAFSLSQAADTLARQVEQMVDRPAAQGAREAALQLEGLSDLLTDLSEQAGR